MFALNRCAILMLVGSAIIASAQDVERYRHFATEGILDVRVSNQVVHERVRAGIASDDPDVVEWTIKALGALSSKVEFGLPNPLGGPLPTRSFAEVAGLKEFLIDHWRERHDASGHDTTRAVFDSFGVRGFEDFAGLALADMGFPDANDESHADRDAAFTERVPAWVMIPGLLCTFWPGDRDVHELLWRDYTLDVADDKLRTMLQYLNDGRFVTPEANELRMEQLVRPAGDWPSSRYVKIAVEGLALSRPPEALPRLIAAVERHPSVKGDVLVVIAGYDDDDLSVFARELHSLLGDLGPREAMGPEADARLRLQALIGSAAR